jgi:hypothetical protein
LLTRLTRDPTHYHPIFNFLSVWSDSDRFGKSYPPIRYTMEQTEQNNDS